MSIEPGARILVIEDDPGIAKLQQRKLERAGHIVTTATGPEEAMRAILQGDFEMIILDYRLTDGCSGLEFYEQLKSRGYNLPTILVTAFSNEALVIRALRAGVRDFVTKSVAYLDYLPDAVGHVLSQSRLEHRLAESEKRFSLMFHANPVPAGLERLDDGRLVEVNDRFAGFFGYAAVDMIGRTSAELGLWADPQERRNILDQVRREGAVRNVEAAFHCKLGEVRTALVSIERIRVSDADMLIAMLVDVTERRRLEEQYRQSQKMEAVGRLAGGIAHDFNNALTVISGYGEIALEATAPDSPQYELLNEIVRAGRHAATLTHQLLAFSRKQVLHPAELDLNDLVKNMHKMLGRLIGEDIELRVKLSPDLGLVLADAGQIEQALLNLAVNSRDAMPGGGVLMLETHNIELDAAHIPPRGDLQPGSWVQLSVGDTGCGMDAETLTRVFEPFYTTKEYGKGTGMGLPMVYGIVKQSGGHVGIESDPGAGTVVRLYLPRVAAGVGEPAATAIAESPPRGTETILLLEDEPRVRSLTRRILENTGYTVIEALNAADALDIVARRAEMVDMLLTDVVMPGMSGRQVADEILRSRPNIRVLFVSGYTNDVVIRQGVLDEGTHFLQKPYSEYLLAHKVRQVLDAPLVPQERAV